MMRGLRRMMLTGAVWLAGLSSAAANPCLEAIAVSERQHGIPHGLLQAVGTVESGRPGADGRLAPWPWTLNIAGEGRWYKTPLAAEGDLTKALTAGVRSVDVGCMQINLAAHPDAFLTPVAGLDPATNVAYAARFLSQLKQETGSWEQAVAYYHSRTPRLAAAYRQKVARAHGAALPGAGEVNRPAREPQGGRVLGAGYQVSPLPVGRTFDAAQVLAQLREQRRIDEIVRRARGR